MPILVSYLPWIVFLAAPGLAGMRAAATLALLIAAALMARDWRRGYPKLMDAKGAAFFAAFVAATFIWPQPVVAFWSAPLGATALFLFALTTILLGRPFTLPYAKEMKDEAVHGTDIFRRAVTVIAVGWTTGFAVMAAGAWLAALGGVEGAGLAGAAIGIGGAVLFQVLYQARLPAA